MGNTPNLGIPPYIQTNASGDNFNLNTYDPETGTEMQAINRKQQIANLLVQQSLAPRQGQMIGNVYVGSGWGEGLAQLGQAAAGAYMTHKNDKARAELENQSQQNVANAMTAYQESQQGRPALTVPDGSQGPERPEMPATPESQRMGLARLMASRDPSVQRFAQYEAQRQAKAAEMQAAQQNALALQAQKAKDDLAAKKTVSGDTDATLANQATQWAVGRTTLSAKEQAELDQKQKEHADKYALPDANTSATLTQHQRDTSATLAQQAVQKDLDRGLQERLHRDPSGNALVSAGAQGQVALMAHNDRLTQMEQNNRNDQAQLELRKQQGMSEIEYKRDKAAMDERHAKAMEQLTAQGHAIQAAAHAAGSKPPSGYRQTADGNLEAIPGGPADVKAQAAQTKLEGGRSTVSNLVTTLRDHYQQLDQSGGITNPDKGALDNLAAGAGSSGLGQAVGRMFGTQNQSLRNQITQQRPLLLNAIKEATGMSAKQMDSNAEMKMYLSAATDPTLDVKANLEALDMLDKLYGLSGQAPAAAPATSAPAQTASAVPKGPIKIANDADYNALPDGADYIDPNGQQRTKGKKK